MVVGLATGLIPPPKHALADSSHIVSIYYDGQKKVITTNATTVGAALQEAGVTTGEGDSVEPGSATVLPEGFYNINVYRSRPVLVIDGTSRKVIETASQSPILIAQAAGLTVYPEDTYSLSTINDVVNSKTVGQELIVHRATPVTLVSDGQQQVVRTQQKTVDGLLVERDVAFGPQDTVVPGRTTAISSGMQIQINRVRSVVIAQSDSIPRTVKTIKDDTLQLGTTKVDTEGSDGIKVSTYRTHYTNGIEDGRQLLTQVISAQPVTKVVRVGTLPDSTSWARLRQCESGNNYANKNNKTYRGAYQFSYSTWASVGGHGDPADASPAEQDMRAQMLYQRRGWAPWECASIIGLR